MEAGTPVGLCHRKEQDGPTRKGVRGIITVGIVGSLAISALAIARHFKQLGPKPR